MCLTQRYTIRNYFWEHLPDIREMLEGDMERLFEWGEILMNDVEYEILNKRYKDLWRRNGLMIEYIEEYFVLVGFSPQFANEEDMKKRCEGVYDIACDEWGEILEYNRQMTERIREYKLGGGRWCDEEVDDVILVSPIIHKIPVAYYSLDAKTRILRDMDSGGDRWLIKPLYYPYE